MTELLDWNVYAGKIYAIAKYSDGSIYHFYDGVAILDWYQGIVRIGMADNSGIAAHLQSLLAADATYTVTRVGNVITIEAAVAGTPFTILAEAENSGVVNDQTAVVALTVANVPAVAEVLSTVSFNVTAGTANPGVNKLSTLTIAGVEALGAAVDWITSNNVTAANIATQINTFNSVPEYTAVAVGQTVTISAAAGSGASPNGFTVVITPAGTVAVDGAAAATPVTKNMAGGVNGVVGQKQKNTVTIGGTFDPGDRFSLTIDNKNFGAKFNPRIKGDIALTHQQKMYVGATSVLQFSAAGDATLWNTFDDAGAGFINMSTNSRGSQVITGLATYQGKLAVLSRRVIQIWFTDVDDTLNTQQQVMEQTGTFAKHSVLAINDMDVFYLSDSGIRSLRARDINNTATVNDVGTAIDPLVRDQLNSISATVAAAAYGILEPLDGRYWLAVGGKIFVFTYFLNAQISAWSWYEPGFTVDAFAVAVDRVYARSGNTVYLYGGDDNNTYDSSVVTAQLPFFSAKKHGTYKEIEGIDIAATGKWTMTLLVDPNNPTTSASVQIGQIDGFTYQQDNIAALGHFTHIAPLLVNQDAGYASLSNVTMYYQGAEDE